MFSHLLCNYPLFITSDFDKATFTTIANVLTVTTDLEATGIEPIWIIVPNKTTVYLGYGALNKYPRQYIWQLFAQHSELIAPEFRPSIYQEKKND